MRHTLLVISLLTLATGGVSAEESDDSVFTGMDIFELEVAQDIRISPDGSRIAYVRQSMDIMTDRPRGNIWTVAKDGRNHRPLLSGTASYSTPRWSPSGDRLAYIADVDAHGPELFVRWMDSGQTAQLSNLSKSPSALSWSPDGKQIAFVMFVASKPEPLVTPPAKPEGAQWAPPVKVIDAIRYRADGAGYLEAGDSQLFVLSADGGTPRQLTNGAFNHRGPLSWSNDSQTLYFSANRKDDWEFDPVESELYALNVTSKAVTQLTDRDGPDFAPQLSPDGRKIAYLGFDDQKMGYHNVRAYVMNSDGSDVRELTGDLDRSVESVAWRRGSSDLLISFDDQGRRHIASLTLDGRIERLAGDVGGVSLGRPYTSGDFTTSANGEFAYTAGRPDRPADVGYGDRSGKTKRLTDLNDDLFAHKTLSSIERIQWQSSLDQLAVEGWLVKPANFDKNKTYPLILEIHGGPFAAYGPQFSSEVQLYAAAGYVVLYTNPRGSTSYGFDFANEIHHDYPNKDYHDLMSGVDAVIAQGYVDPEQLFVTGGSGGGVLTAWIVGKTDRFRAAVAAKPVINWISTVLTTDIATFMPQYWFEKPPWEDPMGYWRRSPLSLVGNVSTPTMLLTGESDHRTPIPESEQFYQALKLRKIDTVMVRVPEAPHGIAGRPSNLIAKVANILAWFERYRDKGDAQ